MVGWQIFKDKEQVQRKKIQGMKQDYNFPRGSSSIRGNANILIQFRVERQFWYFKRWFSLKKDPFISKPVALDLFIH